MRIGIVGAGAVGRWLAFAHQKAGMDVTLFCHNPIQAKTLERDGLRVEHGGQTYHTKLHAVTWDSALTAESEPIELWIVTVKAHQWPGFYHDWLTYRNRMIYENSEHRKPIWIALHNGIVDYKIVAPELQPHILRSICTYGLTAVEDCRVQVRGEGNWLVEQSLDPKEHIVFERWRKALESTVRIQEVSDIDVHLWRKLLVNASLNPITALTRLENGKAWDNPHSKTLILQLLSEAQAICKLQLGYEIQDAITYVEEVCQQTYWNRSSMLQDLEAGRTTEIDAINGWLLRNAEQVHLQVPYNQAVYQLVKAQEDFLSTGPLSR
jgi:2-dehydropantoate 2-reductase